MKMDTDNSDGEELKAELELIRKYGNEILDKIYFKNCNETIKKIINIVTEYMQESE